MAGTCGDTWVPLMAAAAGVPPMAVAATDTRARPIRDGGSAEGGGSAPKPLEPGAPCGCACIGLLARGSKLCGTLAVAICGGVYVGNIPRATPGGGTPERA